MSKRELSLLLALALVLFCLTGCSDSDCASAEDPLAAYDGTWYLAKNGVACDFGDGKIYRDDKTSPEGQTLTGIYDWAEDHIDAHVTGTGGLKEPKALYLVSGQEGDVLCDSADGSGTTYFYRDALAVLYRLEAEEAAQAGSLPAQTPAPLSDADDPAPSSSADPSQAPEETPLAPEDLTVIEAAVASPTPAPEPTAGTPAKGSAVWVSQSGSKYHKRSGCSGMKKPVQMDRSEAESKGYTPCKRCY